MDIGSTVFILTPQTPKLVFESVWVKKAIFIHIQITGSLISILFLPKTFFRCMGGVRYVSWLSDLRFPFWPSKPQKLTFWKLMSWKSCFHSKIDNRESDFHSITTYNILCMCGRCALCFMAIESTVCVLTPQTQKTLFLKVYELKKLFLCVSW